jgi:hypothetical protein
MPAGSIELVKAALEAAGVIDEDAADILAGVCSDHRMFAPESEHIAQDRARGYVQEVRDLGHSLGTGAAGSLEDEFRRYFMTE